MKVFRDLTIRLNGLPYDRFAELSEAAATGGWSRDREGEKHLQFGRGDVWNAFVLHGVAGLSPVYLWLTKRDDGTLYVPNIISTARSQLSRGEFNDLIQSFAANVIARIDAASGITFSLSDGSVDFAKSVPANVFARLREFSARANKETGSSHPFDRERWFRFLIELDASGISLDAHRLQRWLVEDEGWDEQHASRLTEEYEYGRELLALNRAS